MGDDREGQGLPGSLGNYQVHLLMSRPLGESRFRPGQVEADGGGEGLRSFSGLLSL